MMGAGAIAALGVGTATGQSALAGWPMVGHDAGLSSRSTAQSAQRPVLVSGWPRPGVPYTGPIDASPIGRPQALVGANGALLIAGGPVTDLLNANGTIRRVLPVGQIHAIDTAGNLLGLLGNGALASYTPQGRQRWTAGIFGGPSAAESGILVLPSPDGNTYVNSQDGITAVGPTGHVLWTDIQTAEGQVPLAVGPDGTLYFVVSATPAGTSDLLNARHPDGSLAWPSPTTLPGLVDSIAVAPDGSLRVLDRNRNLSAVAADGHLLWSVPVPGLAVPAGGGIAIAADDTTIVYVSGAFPTWPNIQPGIGSVTAVDATGHALWRVNGSFIGGKPIIGGDGTIYVPGAPLVALRPNGTPLFALATGTPLVPEAIGTDGTLYAANLRSGAPIIALASPLGRAGSVVPNPASLHWLISPLSMTTRFRTHGAAVLCPTPGRPCSPTTSLGSMVSFTLRSPATVLFTVRRASDGRPVVHTAQRLLAGPTWEEFASVPYPDSAWIFPQYLLARGGPLRPGRYTITARASVGGRIVQTHPVGFVILN
jgi:hypothetical protein